MKKIILASQSSRRREILSKIGLEFEVIPSDFEEDMTLKLSPPELVKVLALGKAESVAKKYTDAIIIGADTIIALDGKVFGKARDEQDAIETLRFLSGKCHSVFTGWVVIDTETGKNKTGVSETKVYFKTLSEKEIAWYAATGEPMLGAGSYFMQGGAARFVEKIDGDYYNVIGLPIIPILSALKDFGVDVLA